MNEGNICPALVYRSFNKLSLQLNGRHCEAKTKKGGRQKRKTPIGAPGRLKIKDMRRAGAKVHTGNLSPGHVAEQENKVAAAFYLSALLCARRARKG